MIRFLIASIWLTLFLVSKRAVATHGGVHGVSLDTGVGILHDIALWKTANFTFIDNPQGSLAILNETESQWPNLNLIYQRWQSQVQSSVTLPIDWDITERVLVQVMTRSNPLVMQPFDADEYWPVRIMVNEELAQVTKVKSATFQMSDGMLWKLTSFTVSCY